MPWRSLPWLAAGSGTLSAPAVVCQPSATGAGGEAGLRQMLDNVLEHFSRQGCSNLHYDDMQSNIQAHLPAYMI